MSVGGSRPSRLLLVDDHDLARAGVGAVLNNVPCVEIVGEATNGREAVALSARLRPDLVLMDVRMPDMDGLEATRKIKRGQPSIAVLMLTMHEDPDYLLKALRAGAAGYVLKGTNRDRLVSAVREVLSGGSPLDPGLSAQLLKRFAGDPRMRTGPPGREASPNERPAESLSGRELEVLGLIAQGHTNRKIAGILSLAPGTVKRHVEHIIQKLEVSDRTQAAVKAYELNLLDPPGR